MTNKVKPFYIRITDEMTPQMVQDAFDKCRKLGVDDTELCSSLDFDYWEYFGVCGRDGWYYSDYKDDFHGNAKEITLDQLDEWLGLEVEQEWDGEGLPPVGVECEILDVNGNEVIGNGVIYHVDGSRFFVLSELLKDYPEESTINMFD